MPTISAATPRLARLVALGAACATGLWTVAIAPGPSVARAEHSPARSTRTLTLNERGRLRLTSRHGFTLNEQGTATGTLAGSIYVHLKIVSTSQVLAEVSIYAHGGSVSCHARASYRRGTATASFAGALSIDSGTGSYAHARGANLSFSGTIQRSNEAIAVYVSGRASA